MKPLWLLDVDGVINAIAGHRTKAQARFPEGEWKMVTLYPQGFSRGLKIIYDLRVVEFINEMHHSGKVEIKWLTTWVDQANSILAPALGLPTLEVVGSQNDMIPSMPWWKLALAQREAAERDVIWTDDDMPFSSSAQQWVKSLDNMLAIAPADSRGLTHDHLDLIRKFVAGE